MKNSYNFRVGMRTEDFSLGDQAVSHVQAITLSKFQHLSSLHIRTCQQITVFSISRIGWYNIPGEGAGDPIPTTRKKAWHSVSLPIYFLFDCYMRTHYFFNILYSRSIGSAYDISSPFWSTLFTSRWFIWYKRLRKIEYIGSGLHFFWCFVWLYPLTRQRA
jgi:hypothetical protein